MILIHCDTNSLGHPHTQDVNINVRPGVVSLFIPPLSQDQLEQAREQVGGDSKTEDSHSLPPSHPRSSGFNATASISVALNGVDWEDFCSLTLYRACVAQGEMPIGWKNE